MPRHYPDTEPYEPFYNLNEDYPHEPRPFVSMSAKMQNILANAPKRDPLAPPFHLRWDDPQANPLHDVQCLIVTQSLRENAPISGTLVETYNITPEVIALCTSSH